MTKYLSKSGSSLFNDPVDSPSQQQRKTKPLSKSGTSLINEVDSPSQQQRKKIVQSQLSSFFSSSSDPHSRASFYTSFSQSYSSMVISAPVHSKSNTSSSTLQSPFVDLTVCDRIIVLEEEEKENGDEKEEEEEELKMLDQDEEAFVLDEDVLLVTEEKTSVVQHEKEEICILEEEISIIQDVVLEEKISLQDGDSDEETSLMEAEDIVFDQEPVIMREKMIGREEAKFPEQKEDYGILYNPDNEISEEELWGWKKPTQGLKRKREAPIDPPSHISDSESEGEAKKHRGADYYIEFENSDTS
eukprot:TRINITY_DN2825_c0_g2_i2.p1 TRINITY_DN2825_c0_g2~~TRINITY_DN2825_c0_g2_i2.p1  ORF type:complete len:302 (-),score=91.29 TRINITY_DN2825_c0_g2_i2:68-973(-)